MCLRLAELMTDLDEEVDAAKEVYEEKMMAVLKAAQEKLHKMVTAHNHIPVVMKGDPDPNVNNDTHIQYYIDDIYNLYRATAVENKIAGSIPPLRSKDSNSHYARIEIVKEFIDNAGRGIRKKRRMKRSQMELGKRVRQGTALAQATENNRIRRGLL